MARKRFVLMAENKEIASGAFRGPYTVMASCGIMHHPATEYFVAAWVNEDDFHPTILDGFGNDRECAKAVVRAWNRLEHDTWIPEDTSS